jgi:UDP-N-acetyl-D-mannosaminuronate dehydrogenase
MYWVKNKTALVLGLGFRPNVKEDAVSITYLLSEELANAGFTVSVHDVEFSADEIRSKGFNAGEIYSGNTEVVFLATMHKEYYGLDFEKLSGSGVRIFVDGRNSVDRNKVTAAGITYIGIGR